MNNNPSPYYPGNGYPGGFPYNGQPNGGGYPNGNGQGNGNAYPHGFANGGGNNPAQARTIQWTVPALQQVQQMAGNPRFGGNPQGWHEDRVNEYVAANVPQANRVRIRKPVHVGGQDPAEEEHITISCLTNNRALGTMHVYT